MKSAGSKYLKILGSIAAAAMIAMVFGSQTITVAEAQSRLCRNLEAKLASSNKGRSRKFAQAARKQRGELRKVQRRARALDCHLPGIFRLGRDGGECRALQQTMRKMQANLRKLDKRAGGKRLTGVQRRKILARLDANNCRNRGRKLPREVRKRDPKRSLPQLKNRIVIRGADGEIPISSGLLVGTYRTMCVRSCDGYYFPISFSARQDEFQRDRLICKSMCPGTDVALYLHPSDKESEDMVSLTGEPYIDHPNALRYRTAKANRDPSCTCRTAKSRNYTVLAGKTPLDLENEREAGSIAPPIPSPRPDPLEDPETLANRDGKFGPDQVRAMLGRVNSKTSGEEENVRVVGPAFLPDPEGAIDLKAPVQNSFP